MKGPEGATDPYFEWLVYQTGFGFEHYNLFRELYRRRYIYFVPYDENRAEDGLQLRKECRAELGIDPDEEVYKATAQSPCTLLEMLIALCRRLDSIISRGINAWFFELVANCLGDFPYNEDFLKVVRHDHYIRMLDNLQRREYRPDGSNGSLFPLKCKDDVDLRKVELWSQAHLYLDENYSLL